MQVKLFIRLSLNLLGTDKRESLLFLTCKSTNDSLDLILINAYIFSLQVKGDIILMKLVNDLD